MIRLNDDVWRHNQNSRSNIVIAAKDYPLESNWRRIEQPNTAYPCATEPKGTQIPHDDSTASWQLPGLRYTHLRMERVRQPGQNH